MKGKKTHNLAVVVGKYMKGGEQKNAYLNVGCVFEGEYGPYILLTKTFNPAGIPGDDPSVFVKMLEHKDSDTKQNNNRYDGEIMPF